MVKTGDTGSAAGLTSHLTILEVLGPSSVEFVDEFIHEMPYNYTWLLFFLFTIPITNAKLLSVVLTWWDYGCS